MKNNILIIIIFFSGLSTFAQTRQGDIMSQERCKEITEYYSKQYIIDEILKVQDRQSIGVYIDAITAAKSGELTTVLYQCDALNKKGLVFVFWNDFWTESTLPYKGFGFYDLEMDKANELFIQLETLMNQKNKVDALNYSNGNIVYKSDDLTFLFYSKSIDLGSIIAVRVWYKMFDSDWTKTNLQTTIKRFRKFFDLTK